VSDRAPGDRLAVARRGALGLWTAVGLALMFMPVLLIVAFSFNDHAGRFNLTWQGFTLRYWQDAFAVPQLNDALVTSLLVATATTAIALAIGALLAVALVRHRFALRGPLGVLAVLPLASPEIVLGSALLGLFLTLNFATGFATILVAHVVFSIAFVVVTTTARLQQLDAHLEEAAMDLGCTHTAALVRVTLPLLVPALLGAALLTFILSFDDFVITNFTSGATVTLPLYIFGAARQGVPAQVNVLATIVLVAVLLAMFAQVLVARRAGQRDPAASLLDIATHDHRR
jgi:spermidine/putrescine transport system permease protein